MGPSFHSCLSLPESLILPSYILFPKVALDENNKVQQDKFNDMSREMAALALQLGDRNKIQVDLEAKAYLPSSHPCLCRRADVVCSLHFSFLPPARHQNRPFQQFQCVLHEMLHLLFIHTPWFTY